MFVCCVRVVCPAMIQLLVVVTPTAAAIGHNGCTVTSISNLCYCTVGSVNVVVVVVDRELPFLDARKCTAVTPFTGATTVGKTIVSTPECAL